MPYTAAKGGVRQLTRGMAVELAPHNIQVNAIAPGYFATEMNRALLDNAEVQRVGECKRTPAGRWGEPEEIAGLAVFLASAAANYITGQMLMIDGGMRSRCNLDQRQGPSACAARNRFAVRVPERRKANTGFGNCCSSSCMRAISAGD